MNKTVIYFLRHGEVENPKKILYGRLPGYGLSESGIKRIKEVAQEFKDKNIDYIYCSPLRRAKETAEIINRELAREIKISRSLIEVKLIHQGMPLEVFKKDIQPQIYDDFFLKKGQESVKSQQKRMFNFIKMIIKRHFGKHILAVSHGDPIVILKAKLLGVPFTWEFKHSNYLKPGYYITVICEDNRYKVE